MVLFLRQVGIAIGKALSNGLELILQRQERFDDIGIEMAALPIPDDADALYALLTESPASRAA